MNILIDYLRFTSKIHNWVDLAEMLGLQKVDWEQGKARDGWLCHEFFGGIHLYHGGRDDAGVELSGAGCRMLETCNGNSFDWVALFSYIREQGDEMNPRPAPLSAVPHGTAAPQPYSYALTSEQQRRHQRLHAALSCLPLPARLQLCFQLPHEQRPYLRWLCLLCARLLHWLRL